MKKNHINLGFTLVELVVVATILVVLTSLGFYSYVGSLEDSRDSARKSDIAKLSSALTLYHQKRGIYPTPGKSINIIATGTTVALQGKMDTSVSLSTLDQLSFDPKTKSSYTYSITANKQEFQISGTLENNDNPKAIMNGDYKTVAINSLPTITLATDSVADIDISSPANKQLFVFDGGSHNLVYTFSSGNPSYSDGTSFENLISDPLIDFWQNSDFRSCTEIRESGKSLGDGEYQILDNSGTLTSTGCTSM